MKQYDFVAKRDAAEVRVTPQGRVEYYVADRPATFNDMPMMLLGELALYWFQRTVIH